MGRRLSFRALSFCSLPLSLLLLLLLRLATSMEAPLLPTTPDSPPMALALDSVPDDVAFAIASLLGAWDLCSLGSCSRFWHRLCASDFLWSSLSTCRWPPSLEGSSSSSSPSSSSASSSSPGSAAGASVQGGKRFYISRHQEMASKFSNVVSFVERSSQNKSLEGADFLKAVADLHSMEAGFVDVKVFLLTANHSVLLNLIGLHYLIFSLHTPGARVLEALRTSRISERRVCVNWFKLGRWFYGFRLPDESRSRRLTLSELATSDEEVGAVLNRGVIHEVLRVQVTALPA